MRLDVSALNASERRVLVLLGEGHTAKSIAAETGLSVNAVNERLREARRKTGVGSSRELARLFRESGPQENWNEIIELSPVAPIPPERPNLAAHRTSSGWLRGRIAMTSLTLGVVAVAAFLLMVEQDPAAAPPRVVATSPGQDAPIPAGPFTLSVTFDQPMRGDGWSLVGDPALAPDCAKAPRMSADGRTFTFACRAEAGRGYAVGFNGGQFLNFRSREGVSAEPYPLRFHVR